MIAMRTLALLGAALAAVACGSSSSPSAAPGQDAGDSMSDGGSPQGDAQVSADAAAPSLGRACTDAIGDAYTIPAGLPAMTDASRGDVVRCAVDSSIDASAMASRLQSATVANVAVASGATTYRIAYRTKRGDGSDGMSSARVFVPTAPRTAALPAIVAAHGTSGLADACAVSKYETINDYLVLPWVAHGYAVILPDYAGLGNGGVQGYGDNTDTGYSTLDAARALRKLLAPGALTNGVLVYGHSQGGGSALSAQALAKSYGADGDLLGVIGFAAGWNVAASVDGLRDASVQTNVYGGGPAAFGALFSYAYFANHVGRMHAGDGFGASARPSLDTLVGSQCIVQLVSSIPQAAPTVGDLFDATFRSTAIACTDGTAGCADPGKGYVAYLRNNILKSDAFGAKVLVVQGLADTTVPASTEACVVEKLKSDGVSPVVCVDSTAQHLTVVQQNAAFALAWTDALVDGKPAPACPGTAMLPACQ